jgi:hypothetical protein
MSNLITVLGYAVFASTAVLTIAALVNFLDVHADLTSARMNSTRISVHRRATGFWRLGVLRCLDAALFLVLGIITVQIDASWWPLYGRVVFILLIWVQILKLATERYTRVQIDLSLEIERHEVTARQDDEKHREVLTRLEENLAETKSAKEASHAAETTANQVNEKIEDLNQRLLESKDK